MQNNSNQYFETPHGVPNEINEETLVARMADCTIILSELSESQAWKILLDDVRSMIKTLDDKWQELLPDSPQFREARCVKMAFKHISDIPKKYLEELNMIEEKLKQMKDLDKEIPRDTDNT